MENEFELMKNYSENSRSREKKNMKKKKGEIFSVCFSKTKKLEKYLKSKDHF